MGFESVLIRVLVLAGVALAVAVVIKLLRNYFGAAEVPKRFDVHDAGLNGAEDTRKPLLVEFVSPFCYECKEVMPILKAASVVHGTQLAVIDAKVRPDLATKYSIRHTPTILLVDVKGTVQAGWLGKPPDGELESALNKVSKTKALKL